MVLRNANPLRAVFDCLFNLQDNDPAALLPDFGVIAPFEYGLYGFDGFFIHKMRLR